VLIETQGALRDVWKIAALPWLQVLDFGLMDFVSGHQGAVPDSAMRSPGQFDHKLIARAKTETVAAALANGVVPAHNVTLDLKNRYQTYDDARRANMEFGFQRMWSIYPTQIESILDAMQPDFSKLTVATEILLKAQDANWGPIQHEGELHDRATYRSCWHLLQEAHVFGAKIDERAVTRFFAEA
jgi:citrate lyase subunit beta/citryl-CoA lyase